MAFCRWAASALLLASLQGCAVSWLGADGRQQRAGLMWLRYQQRPTGTMVQANQLGFVARLNASCAGLFIGVEQTDLAAASPELSAHSLPGGWRDDDGISNHLGLVRSSYLPGEGPQLHHASGIGLALRGGQDCFGLSLGWQDSLRILYPDADGYWKTNYDSRAPFDVKIAPAEMTKEH